MKAATRTSLPTDDFGLPAQRKYPMPDAAHAANAKARATQMGKAGKLSIGQVAQIMAKANRKLGKRKPVQQQMPQDTEDGM